MKDGRVARVGLDVFEHEPHSIHEGLLEMEKLGRATLLPHLGTWTVEDQEGMEMEALGNVRSVIEGKGLVNGLSEQLGLEEGWYGIRMKGPRAWETLG